MNEDSYVDYLNEFLKNGELLYNMGEYQQLAAICREFLSQAKNEKVYAMLSSAQYALGDISESEKSARKGLVVNPESPDNLFNLACILNEKGIYTNALRYFYRTAQVGDIDVANECKEEITKLEKLTGKTINELMPKKAKKRVLIIAAIFPPGSGSGVQRTVKLVKYMRFNGWEPIVVTLSISETQKYLGLEYFDELPDDIEIIRIPVEESITQSDIEFMKEKLLPLLSNDLKKEFINFFNKLNIEKQYKLCCFPEPIVLWALTTAEIIDKCIDMDKIDLIYSTSGPYSDHIAAHYIKKIHNKPWVIDFRDEWSGNPVMWPNKDLLHYRMCCNIEKEIINSAEQVIHVTERSCENYLKLGYPSEKLSCITNGFDEEDFDGIDSYIQDEKFVIVHNGLLYADRTALTVINAIYNLIKQGKVDSEKIKFHMGCLTNDEERLEVKTKIKDMGLEDVAVIDAYMEHRESLLLAASANILLLLLGASKDYSSMYPAKIFEYLRLKKPILSLGPKGSIVEELLIRTGAGINIDFSDIKAIEEEILKIYQEWQKNSGEKSIDIKDISMFERKNLVKKHAEVFDKAIVVARKAEEKKLDAFTFRYDEYNSNCIGCSSDKTQIININNQSRFANGYGVINPFRIWKQCSKCDLVYTANMPFPNALTEYYKNHYLDVQSGGVNYSDSELGNLDGYIRYSGNRLSNIEKLTGETGSLLDIGAGRATFIKVAHNRGWQVHGLESSPENVKYAQSKWDIELDPTDFFDYTSEKKYDVITMFEVIEHLIRPWDALDKCASLLNKNGILVIATPFRDSDYVKVKNQSDDFWWSEPSHLTYMCTKSLIRKAEKIGLNAVNIKESEQGAGRLEVYLKKV